MATSYSFGTRDKLVDTITGAYSVEANESGKHFILSAAAGAAVTLPAPSPGLNYRFIVGLAFATTNWTIVTNGNATIIQGGVVVNGASVTGANEDTISFVATAETVGDYVNLVSDGTNWYVDGYAHAAGGITLTDAA
jgi:hypothetical protein